VVKLPEPSEPLSDEEMRAVTIGEPRTERVVIADYDEDWPTAFAREAQRIRAALGPRALAVEHVGSTSVPGLPAKPIIDIDLTVADSADEDSYVPALENAGYVLRIREPDWYEHRLFKGPDTDINLHVFSPGADELERHLLLRDWLRTHPEDRDRYAAAKRELAAREWKYVAHYAHAKTEVIVEILKCAGAV
jgi:GrpB-like predicted nucleotidyltransferase (UPF0157 family)